MTPERTPSFSLMQAVKRRFFAMRNGDLAAQMARGGINYRINFGLNLPQITEIAQAARSGRLPDNAHIPDNEERRELARLLWENDTTRESRLIAPMLYDADDLNADLASGLLRGVTTTEEADVLCHRLLRRYPAAEKLALEILADSGASEMQRYGALRLLMNLMIMGRADLAATEAAVEAERQRDCRLTAAVCRQLRDEIDFAKE